MEGYLTKRETAKACNLRLNQLKGHLYKKEFRVFWEVLPCKIITSTGQNKTVRRLYLPKYKLPLLQDYLQIDRSIPKKNKIQKNKKWTQSSKDCYKRGCRCNGCIYQKLLSSPCRLKETVIDLVREFGAPEEI